MSEIALNIIPPKGYVIVKKPKWETTLRLYYDLHKERLFWEDATYETPQFYIGLWVFAEKIIKKKVGLV